MLLGAAANQRLRLPRLPRQVRLLPDGQLTVGGNWAPMALLMLTFWLRYAIAASLAVVPAPAGEPVFMAGASALYGVASGLFGTRAWRVLQQRGQAMPVASAVA